MAYEFWSDWDYVRTNAVRCMANRDDFAYLYGGNGEYLATRGAAENMVRKMWNAYPDHFRKYVTDTGHTIEELVDHVLYKRVADCSGAVCWLTQGKAWGSLSVKLDMNSSRLISVCEEITTPAKGVCGSLLWRPGHVALDVGGGAFVEFAAEFADVRLRPIKDGGFQQSGQLPWVDYACKLAATDR